MTTADVIIVGAGPTGLLLAGDLAEAGVPVTILERRSGTESNMTRAFGVHARTLEQLDLRGVADELVATGNRLSRLQLFQRVEFDLSRLPTRFPYMLVTPQYETERVLERRARRLGVTIEHGTTVVGLDQDASGVDLTVEASDGSTQVRRAGYVAGADGYHSGVRAALGLPFPGRSVLKSIMLADVKLAEPPAELLAVNGVGDAFAFIASFGDGYYRIFCWDRHRQVPDDEPLDLPEVIEITRRALGTDYGMHSPRWMARFHSDERQVPRYRVGRVFLAGDAAHVHSPAGGQGMNTGLQDAANLGWKLAAAAHGRAPDGLLDTYQTERHPVGRSVLRSSALIIRGAMLQPRILRELRNMAGHLVFTFGPTFRRATGQLTGIGYHYPAPHGAHRLTGRRAPDVRLADSGRLYEALRGGRFALLSTAPAPLDGWTDRVTAVTPAASGRTTILVRPDGYIATATDETDPARRAAAIRAALSHWVGPPAT